MDANRPPRPESSPQNDPDLDLAKLLYKTARTIKSFFRQIFRGFEQVVIAILTFFLFLFRNILWILLGIALGLSYGIYVRQTRGTTYESKMIVKANFNSSRTLYNSAEYFNALISNNKLDEMAHLFDLTSSEARMIEGFFVEPVESELITAEAYKDLFLASNRGSAFAMDTSWARTLNYKDFKKSITKYDYPLQEISVVSRKSDIFSKLQQGILQQVGSIPLLKELARTRTVSNSDEEKVLKSAIASIDSLREAYNQRLRNGRSTSTEGNSLFLTPSNKNETVVPELQVYDKLLDLQDELKKNRTRAVSETNVLEVYSPFNAVGKEVSLFKQSVFRYTIIGLIGACIIVSVIALYRRSRRFEKSNKIA